MSLRAVLCRGQRTKMQFKRSKSSGEKVSRRHTHSDQNWVFGKQEETSHVGNKNKNIRMYT